MKYIILIFYFLLPSFSEAADSINQRDMRAALIYNFAQFTTWSETKEDVFNICIFEQDQENINVEILKSKKLNNKPIRINIISRSSELENCKVLYTETVEREVGMKKEIAQIKSNLLTIAEKSPSNQTNEGIIQIQLENKRYQFSINNEAAKSSGLMLSSKLLRLATKVY